MAKFRTNLVMLEAHENLVTNFILGKRLWSYEDVWNAWLYLRLAKPLLTLIFVSSIPSPIQSHREGFEPLVLYEIWFEERFRSFRYLLLLFTSIYESYNQIKYANFIKVFENNNSTNNFFGLLNRRYFVDGSCFAVNV